MSEPVGGREGRGRYRDERCDAQITRGPRSRSYGNAMRDKLVVAAPRWSPERGRQAMKGYLTQRSTYAPQTHPPHPDKRKTQRDSGSRAPSRLPPDHPTPTHRPAPGRAQRA